MSIKNKPPRKPIIIWGVISIIIWIAIMIIIWWLLFCNIKWSHISKYTTLLTADSLLTGATVTLIAFSNMSPSGSASSHIIKKSYWNSFDISTTEGKTKKSTSMEKFLMFFGPIITPSIVLVTSFFATLIEIIILFILSSLPNANEGALISTLFIMIFITMFLLVSSVIRYIVFNHNPIKITSRYIQGIVMGGRTSFESSLYLLSYINGTKNFELLLVTSKKIQKYWKEYGDTERVKKINQEFSEHFKSMNSGLLELTDLERSAGMSEIARLLIIFGSYSLISIKKNTDTEHAFSARFISHLDVLGKDYIVIIKNIADAQFWTPEKKEKEKEPTEKKLGDGIKNKISVKLKKKKTNIKR